MANPNNKAVLTMMLGLSVFGSLMLGTAFAAPPKGKKPPAKPAPKKETPKKDDPAAIAAGKKVYDAQGCAGCHAIAGEGGKNGPELTKVAADAKHTPKWLEEAVVNPQAHHSSMPSYADKVKGKDLSNMVAYLGSLKK